MIHVFTMNGCNIAVDGNSGSVHVLDNISNNILKNMEKFTPLDEMLDLSGVDYSAEDIVEAYNEIMILKEQNLLFSSDEIISEAIATKKNTDGMKALCLHVSHDCNLNCEYCFASKGDYRSGRKLMSGEVALKAVDFLVENSGERQHIEIDFFGGEPLMNFEVVEKAVVYGRQIENKSDKKFHFTITTNGTLLDKYKIEFINEQMDNVVISLDGRKEVHDAIRYDKAGRGSYDRIVPLAQELVAGRKGKSYFIRGTYTAKNKDFSKDVMHLADLGFKEISVEPVVGSENKFFIKESDIPEILREYEEFAVEYLKCLREGKDIRFYHFNVDLYKGPCIYKRVAACGAGFEYFAVSPEGYLYPCHQFVGQEGFVVGDIYNGINNVLLCNSFKGNNILSKEKCRDCWAKLLCAGGCHANAWYSNGDIAQPNDIACTLQKKRIECAIMIQVARQKDSKVPAGG